MKSVKKPSHVRKVKSPSYHNAPRLAYGKRRDPIGHGLPPDVKHGLRAIARGEGRSLSWVLEDCVLDYFGLPRPRYRKRKRTAARGDKG